MILRKVASPASPGSSTGVSRSKPALLTSTSSAPISAITSATRARSDISQTWAATGLPASPAFAFAASKVASSSASTINSAPVRAKPIAMPQPMLRLAPVTSTRLPLKSK